MSFSLFPKSKEQLAQEAYEDVLKGGDGESLLSLTLRTVTNLLIDSEEEDKAIEEAIRRGKEDRAFLEELRKQQR